MLNIFKRTITQVTRLVNGSTFYEFGGDANFSKFSSESEMIEYALNNPAFMLALDAKCKLFSLVKIDSYTKDNSIDMADFLHTKVGNPNFMQTWEQFLYDYCFWKSIKTCYVYTPDHNELTHGTQFYNLRPFDIEFKSSTQEKLSKMITTKKQYDDLMNESVNYVQGNSKTPIALQFIKPFFSTTNGLSSNWYEGYSLIDSMTPIMDNVMEVLKAQNINLRYSGKFMGTKQTGKIDLNDLNAGTAVETEDIEKKINSNKEFYALKEPFDVKRFVDSIANLKLDEQFIQQYFLIGKMMGMPKDFLEASLKGTTYENKSEGMAQMVSQVLQPEIDPLLSFFEQKYNINKLVGSWNHLPFMAVFTKRKEEASNLKLLNIKLAQENGAKFTEQELKDMCREALN